MNSTHSLWPDLSYPSSRETLTTLHLWTQVVGKVRLALTPWVNHSWQVPLYVTARGLSTSSIPTGNEVFEIEFDFVDHQLCIRTSRGQRRSMLLQAQSVAAFYKALFDLLDELGIAVRINETPNELQDPIPFPSDNSPRSYEPHKAKDLWRALLQIDRILKQFRSGFLGKVSPVHFFWGSFDLAVSRFSGRTAPPHPGGVPSLPDAVVREAYSHEVSSAGFWPGNDAFPHAAFYSYAYPEPSGYRSHPVTSGAFEESLGEFILLYDKVRETANPDEMLLNFLCTTYAAAAETARWDRAALECPLGIPGKVPLRP